MDKPYLICINAIGIKGNPDFDIKNAIWGTVALTFSDAPDDTSERLEHQADGIFFNKGRARAVNVSGVMITKVMEFNIHEAKHWLVKHPFSKNDIDLSSFELTHQFVSEGIVKTEHNKSIREVLKVEPTWLEE